MRFNEIFVDDTKNVSKINSKEFKDKGKIAIVDQGKNLIAGYTDFEYPKVCNEERIIFGDHTRIFKYISFPFVCGADGTKVLKLINKERISYKYMYYYLLSSFIPNTGYNRHFKWVKELTFNIPKYKIQLDIVKRIDKVNNLIELRKKEIEKCENLIKSQFVDMFGNIKETIRLGDCCIVHARIGWQALSRKEHMKTGDYLLVTGTDFKNNEIDYSTCVYVSKERYEMDKHIILKNNDILITKDGTIGKVAIVHDLPKPATLNGGVFVVRPDDRFNEEYITYVFKGPLFDDFVSKSKTGATIKHLNQKHLVEFNIPLPKMSNQIRFSNLYKKIEKQKKEFEESLEKLEELQSALMQEYFG